MSLNGSGINAGGATQNAGLPEALTRGFNAVVVSGSSGEIVQVTVTVSWLDGSATKNTTLYTELTNWQKR
jgi:hypothetical protein